MMMETNKKMLSELIASQPTGKEVLDWTLTREEDLRDPRLVPLINRACRELGIPLEVRTSTIPGAGYGLFATEDFLSGEPITVYGGEYSPDEREGAYVVNTQDGGTLDARLNFRLGEMGRWANTTTAAGSIGAGIGFMKERGAYLQATRDIGPGEEIFCDYGEHYSFDAPEAAQPLLKKNRCAECRVPTNLGCSACKRVYYCGVQCQRLGFSVHSRTCLSRLH